MDWIDQYEAARRDVAICWVPRDEIAMDGKDAVNVLHKLCSNDITALASDHGCEAFVCNVQGKIVGHVLAYRTDTGLRLVTNKGQAADLIAHLDRYIIREDVRFQHLEENKSLYVLGPDAEAEMKALGAPCPASPLTSNTWAINNDESIIVRRLADMAGYQVTGGLESLQAAVERPLIEKGVAQLNEEAWQAIRIESFVPDYAQDISADNLPQEVARDTASISFTKGCYLGQETVARIDAMGHVNWLLRGVQFPTNSKPQAPAKLQVEGKDVARTTSVCFSPQLQAPLALAYVRRQHATPGSTLSSEYGEATVVQLPLVEA